MAETAKLETIDTAQKTLAAIRQHIDKASSHETMPPIHLIDKGEFNEHVLPYGKWPWIAHRDTTVYRMIQFKEWLQCVESMNTVCHIGNYTLCQKIRIHGMPTAPSYAGQTYH
ncbi:hypothetical protein BYT27DRAFT_7253286 [Phlegmacium glaucopus]|nr:hypothetical protein BYT27DRAFT_7253286 [Phlegmacium glaucopus]